MENDINSMIEDIYHREKEAEQQKTKLSKVRAEIFQCQEMVKGMQEHQTELREKIEDQGCRLQEDEAKLRCWQARCSALEDVKQQIKLQREQVQQSMVNLSNSESEEEASFYSRVNSFLKDYDLLSDGASRRESDVKKKIEETQKKKESIEKELSQVRLHLTSVKDLQWTLDTTRRLIKELERRRNHLEDDIASSATRVRKLQDEKQTLQDLPQKSSEYLQLQAELRSSNVSMKRDEYIQLQEQLADLRRNVDQNYG